MSALLAAGLATLAGLLVAAQAALLGPFVQRMPALTAAMWVNVGGAVFGGLAVAAARAGWGVAGLVDFPWGLLAGVAGVGIVASVGAAVTPLGLGVTIVIVTAAQLVLGLALDAAGVTGRVVPLTAPRVAGAVLVAGGALLMFLRTPA